MALWRRVVKKAFRVIDSYKARANEPRRDAPYLLMVSYGGAVYIASKAPISHWSDAWLQAVEMQERLLTEWREGGLERGRHGQEPRVFVVMGIDVAYRQQDCHGNLTVGTASIITLQEWREQRERML